MSPLVSGPDGPASSPGEASDRVSPAEALLLASVFLIAACGLAYELAAGSLASYLLGDSVLQFSTVIGSYLFALGIGSYLSRFVQRQLVAQFLRVELLVADAAWLRSLLLRLGPSVRAVDPPELASSATEAAREALAAYQHARPLR